MIFVPSLPFFLADFVWTGSLLFSLRRAAGFGGGVTSRDGAGEGEESVDGGGESDEVSDVAAGEDMMPRSGGGECADVGLERSEIPAG